MIIWQQESFLTILTVLRCNGLICRGLLLHRQKNLTFIVWSLLTATEYLPLLPINTEFLSKKTQNKLPLPLAHTWSQSFYIAQYFGFMLTSEHHRCPQGFQIWYTSYPSLSFLGWFYSTYFLPLVLIHDSDFLFPSLFLKNKILSWEAFLKTQSRATTEQLL